MAFLCVDRSFSNSLLSTLYILYGLRIFFFFSLAGWGREEVDKREGVDFELSEEVG